MDLMMDFIEIIPLKLLALVLKTLMPTDMKNKTKILSVAEAMVPKAMKSYEEISPSFSLKI